MSVYLETIARLADEYKRDVLALEAAQGRIAEYEAALPELQKIYKCYGVVVSVAYGKVSVFFYGDGESMPGERVPRAFLAGKPLYNWNGFDVV